MRQGPDDFVAHRGRLPQRIVQLVSRNVDPLLLIVVLQEWQQQSDQVWSLGFEDFSGVRSGGEIEGVASEKELVFDVAKQFGIGRASGQQIQQVAAELVSLGGTFASVDGVVFPQPICQGQCSFVGLLSLEREFSKSSQFFDLVGGVGSLDRIELSVVAMDSRAGACGRGLAMPRNREHEQQQVQERCFFHGKLVL